MNFPDSHDSCLHDSIKLPLSVYKHDQGFLAKFMLNIDKPLILKLRAAAGRVAAVVIAENKVKQIVLLALFPTIDIE